MAGKAGAPAGAQEGSRWINERPSSKEVADWFVQNAPMHDGMDPSRYVTGVTLIPAKEKPKIVAQNGAVVDGPERLVYTPYIKVETRVLYLHDYAAEKVLIPVIEPDPDVPRIRAEGLTNEHLPAGYFRHRIQGADGKWTEYLGYSARVGLYEPPSSEGADALKDALAQLQRRSWKAPPGAQDPIIVAHERGRPVIPPKVGTKIAPVLTRWGPDQNVLMSVQTGAVGRALGFAGMLVLPGSGVATAEDMLDAGVRGVAVEEAEPELPGGEQATQASPKERAAALIAQLESQSAEKYEELQAWARERKLNLGELTDESPALRGVIRQVEKLLEAT